MRSVILLMVLGLVGWFAWNQSGGFTPELRLLVEASSNVAADVYIDRGKGFENVASLMNYYQSQRHPTLLVFPVDVLSAKTIRFDPILLTEQDPLRISIFEISLNVAPFSKPVTIPLKHLVPVAGVHMISNTGGILTLEVPPHTQDPQMILRMPEAIEDRIAEVARYSRIKVAGYAGFGLLFGLFLYFLTESTLFRDKP